MKKSLEIIAKHYAKKNPTFFWTILVCVLLAYAFVWLGMVGPYCISAKSSVLVWFWIIASFIKCSIVVAVIAQIKKNMEE